MRISDTLVEEAVLGLARERIVNGRGICPSEAARALSARMGGDWRGHLPAVRDAAVRLAKRNLVCILRDGRPANPDTFRGLYRIAAFDVAGIANTSPMTAPRLTETAPTPTPAASPATSNSPPAVLTLADLLGDMLDGPKQDENRSVRTPSSEEPSPGAMAVDAAKDEDDDPDLLRDPEAATLDDIAARLERYLTAQFDDAPSGDTEIGDDVVGLAGEPDEEPILPDWHHTFRRYPETPAADEK